MTTTTETETTETYAATYAAGNDLGEFGIDLIHQDVCRDEEGGELYREEAGWDWHPVVAVEWNTDRADFTLQALGFHRTDEWTYDPDLGGNQGWTAPVKRS